MIRYLWWSHFSMALAVGSMGVKKRRRFPLCHVCVCPCRSAFMALAGLCLCLANPSYACCSNTGLSQPAAHWKWPWMNTFSHFLPVSQFHFLPVCNLTHCFTPSLYQSLRWLSCLSHPTYLLLHIHWNQAINQIMIICTVTFPYKL